MVNQGGTCANWEPIRQPSSVGSSVTPQSPAPACPELKPIATRFGSAAAARTEMAGKTPQKTVDMRTAHCASEARGSAQDGAGVGTEKNGESHFLQCTTHPILMRSSKITADCAPAAYPMISMSGCAVESNTPNNPKFPILNAWGLM